MKAICFTFDRNMPIMEYVRYTYFKCWPDNPFVFHIPWNDTKPNHLVEKYGDWIIYKPPFNSNNFLLWILPYLVFMSGGVIIFLLFKKT